MDTSGGSANVRRRCTVNGIVQGVGFRPFVHNLARGEALAGHVVNTSAGVVIEIQGPVEGVDRFFRRLHAEAPPLAAIMSVEIHDLPLAADAGFVIHASLSLAGSTTLIPPDVATCADCLREIRDPANRRAGYPFTNCTNCGPRWTIIERLPYDRLATSMACFAMCADCQAEYENPDDRRFHAQPNACAVCGPRLWLTGGDGGEIATERPLAAAAEALAGGAIVAIRGLGGFHLAVRSDDPSAVERLRRRKHREAKPLALMASDLDAARKIVRINVAEEAAMTSPPAPIVLCERLPDAAVAPAVAPGHRRLGVMLASTPLHHLLFDELARHDLRILVMTSGNIAAEPVCIGNEDALDRLGHLADYWLLHDREILRRADDSVLQMLGGKPLMFRRSRGYAPVPIGTGERAAVPVLAVGGDLKSTMCLLKDNCAFLSPHIGDLEDRRTRSFFEDTAATLQRVLECEPAVIAHDLHPGYFSTDWAQRRGREPGMTAVGVQHHHAHLVATQTEHALSGPAIGLIMDGTGYGSDGTIWGGEILVGDAGAFERAGHFEPVPLPGGDAAIRAPWRIAVSYLRHAGIFHDTPGSRSLLAALATRLPFLAAQPAAVVLDMIERDVNSPLTSSCGRLFDAVAALAGPWQEVAYEAQAAMELMALTDEGEVARAAPLPGVVGALQTRAASAAEEPLRLPVAAMVREVAVMVACGATTAEVSARFHRTLIDVLATAAEIVTRRRGPLPVVLGGGVFLNEILTTGLLRSLAERGLEGYRPRQASPGDGGLALGQAVIAAHRVAAAGR